MIDVIDTHLHFWNLTQRRYPWLEGDDPEHGVLRETFEPLDLERVAGPNLMATVHVQAEMDHALDPVEETAWLHELRRGTNPARPIPTVAVGYADLTLDTLSDVLDRHQEYDFFRGIRQEAWFEPDSPTPIMQHHFDLLSHPRWIGGLREIETRGLTFDLIVHGHQLRQAADVFAQVPELPVVIDHTGLPPRTEDADAWRKDLRYFVERVPNTHVKLSGFWAFASSLDDPKAKRYMLDALDIVGPRRTMTASTYPVERPLGSYGDVWAAMDAIASDLSTDERSQIFVRTAASFYSIDLSGA